MALSDFSENYLDRTAGLRNFVAPVPPFVDFIGKPMNATAMTPTAPDSASGLQSFADKDPTGKAMDIANESYNPGYIAHNDQAAASAAQPWSVQHPALASLAAAVIPGLATSFAGDRGQALADFWEKHAGDNPAAQNIVGAMKTDPIHAREYLPALMNELDPAHAAAGQEAQDKLKSERGLKALFGQEAEGQGQPTAIATPAQPQTPAGYDPRVVAQLESSGGKNNINPLNPNVQGPLQFDQATAARVGLKNPNDMQESLTAAARLGDMNAQQMAPALGRQPTPQELYLAHQQGAGGATALLKNPSANAVSALVGAGVPQDKALKSIIDNGGSPDMTAGQFAQLHAGRYDAAAKALGSPAPQTKALSQISDYTDRLKHEQNLRLRAAAIDPSLAQTALAGRAVQAPATDAGKVMADAAAGNITQSQRDQLLMSQGINPPAPEGASAPAYGPQQPKTESYAAYRATLTPEAKSYLSTLTPEMQSKALGYASANISLPSPRSPTYPAALMMAQKLNSSFNENTVEQQNAVVKDFNTGEAAIKQRSLNTAIAHLDQLAPLINSLHNVSTGKIGPLTKPVNWFGNELQDLSGNPNISAYENHVENLAHELSKAYGGSSGGTETDNNQRRTLFSSSKSPEQLNAVVNDQVKLLGSVAKGLQDQYEKGMVPMDQRKPILTPESVEALKNLGFKTPPEFTGQKDIHPAATPTDLATAAAAELAKRGGG